MLRAERITDLDAVRDELTVYNALLPAPGELSATLLIEITDQDDVRRAPARLPRHRRGVGLEVGSQRIAAEFEPGRSREDKLSAVQYVRVLAAVGGARGVRRPVGAGAPRRRPAAATATRRRSTGAAARFAHRRPGRRRMTPARDAASSRRCTTCSRTSRDHPTAEQVFQPRARRPAARQPRHRLSQPRQAARAGLPARGPAGQRRGALRRHGRGARSLRLRTMRTPCTTSTAPRRRRRRAGSATTAASSTGTRPRSTGCAASCAAEPTGGRPRAGDGRAA